MSLIWQVFRWRLNGTMRDHTRAEGFALVEVMVGLTILGVGLLGLAALQMSGLKSNHDAYIRSQVNLLAYDIVDRMRANRPNALNGLYNIDVGEAPDGGLPAVVFNDLTQWKGTLSNLPGSGDGSIEVDDGVVTVTIQWDEDRDGGDPMQFTIQSHL